MRLSVKEEITMMIAAAALSHVIFVTVFTNLLLIMIKLPNMNFIYGHNTANCMLWESQKILKIISLRALSMKHLSAL